MRGRVPNTARIGFDRVTGADYSLRPLKGPNAAD